MIYVSPLSSYKEGFVKQKFFITETTIFGSKNSEVRILGSFLLYFHQNRTRERATSRISVNFFSRTLDSFEASEKKGVGFRKNIFHACFCCKSAISRVRDFEVKTAFYEVLRANYSHGSELWLQSVLTTQKYEKILSNGVLKFKIEQSYEIVVISIFEPN